MDSLSPPRNTCERGIFSFILKLDVFVLHVALLKPLDFDVSVVVLAGSFVCFWKGRKDRCVPTLPFHNLLLHLRFCDPRKTTNIQRVCHIAFRTRLAILLCKREKKKRKRPNMDFIQGKFAITSLISAYTHARTLAPHQHPYLTAAKQTTPLSSPASSLPPSPTPHYTS